MGLKPGYKQTEAGVIPEEWNADKLGNFVSLQRGHDLTWRDRRMGNVPVMGSAGQNGFHDTALAKAPGVVLGRSGASFGHAHFCEQDFWPHNTALYVTDFHRNDPLFVFYFLSLIDFTRHNSGGAQQSLNRNFIYPIHVGFPGPPEQRAIAAGLRDVDALLGALTQLIAKKRDLKQAAMQQLLTGRTRLPGFRGEWGVRPLGDVVTLHRENVIPANSPTQLFVHFSLPAFDTGKAPAVEPGAAIGSNKLRVSANAVLVAKLNPRIPRVWAPVEIPDHAVCSTEFLVLVPKADISRGFLSAVCSSPRFCEQMESAATGTTGSHQRMNPADALKIEAPFPPTLPEQAAIAAVLSDMDAEIAALETRLAKTRALKQGMMQELLTGRTRFV